MNNNKTIDGYDLSGVSYSNLHGLTLDQYYLLLKHQKFMCPISGFKFVYDSDKKSLLIVEMVVGLLQKENQFLEDHHL